MRGNHLKTCSVTKELSSLQCYMQDRSPKSLFLEEIRYRGDDVSHWQVSDRQSLCISVQKTPHITAYCNFPDHESSSGRLAFDPHTVACPSKVVPFPVSPLSMEMTYV